MEARIHVLVSGKVQGVFYRANTRLLANELGVKGWIKNLQDGNVEIIAEGRKNALDKLIEFCNRGPVGAKVENVDVSWDKPKKEFDIFDVKL